jgi:hypothetical protein
VKRLFWNFNPLDFTYNFREKEILQNDNNQLFIILKELYKFIFSFLYIKVISTIPNFVMPG